MLNLQIFVSLVIMINLILKKYRNLFNISPEAKVFIIGGGEVFEKYDDYITWLQKTNLRENNNSWKTWLTNKLEYKNYQVIRINMPNSLNAHYEEWLIWFQKYLPNINNSDVLIGHSLGGIFLAKYLSSDHKLLKKLSSVHLVAAPFNYCYDFNTKKTTLPNVSKIHLYQSFDDKIVKYKDSLLEVYSQNKNNQTNLHDFSNYGHF
ncbi:hypothetical protein HC766_08105 [Candidatus Gracilibacteria bacterium]|nr:hypothetical protein [Candidatus Gracilibacteria bacterium]